MKLCIIIKIYEEPHDCTDAQVTSEIVYQDSTPSADGASSSTPGRLSRFSMIGWQVLMAATTPSNQQKRIPVGSADFTAFWNSTVCPMTSPVSSGTGHATYVTPIAGTSACANIFWTCSARLAITQSFRLPTSCRGMLSRTRLTVRIRLCWRIIACSLKKECRSWRCSEN